MNHTRLADWVTIWVVHLLEQTELIIPSDQTVLAVHNCSSWFGLFFTERERGHLLEEI